MKLQITSYSAISIVISRGKEACAHFTTLPILTTFLLLSRSHFNCHHPHIKQLLTMNKSSTVSRCASKTPIASCDPKRSYEKEEETFNKKVRGHSARLFLI